MNYIDMETGLRNYGTVEVGAVDGRTFEHDPRVIQFWIASEHDREPVAARLDGVVARGAHIEWFQASVENVAAGYDQAPVYRIVVTLGLQEPLGEGSLSLTLWQPGGNTFRAVQPLAWLTPSAIGVFSITDIADFDVFRNDVFELGGGATAPFKFQTWINPSDPPTDPPRLIRLTARHFFSSSFFDMALRYGKVFWKDVSGTGDFRIVVEGELHERFPGGTSKLNVSVWQRGGRSFTLSKPTHWVDE